MPVTQAIALTAEATDVAGRVDVDESRTIVPVDSPKPVIENEARDEFELLIDEDAVRTYCKGVLAHYKVPRYVRFVEDFPMTVTGKIQKFEMRKVMISELGLREQETA